MHTLIVLIGPTGVGKTELSLRLAEHFHTCIVSADSRQLYADLKIGTAAPTPEQLQRVQHHFVGTLKLTDYYSAAQYEAEVMKLLEDLFTKHNTVLLTGGSMMYVDAVCKGIDDIPTVDADTRQLMLHKYETEGLERLCAELKLLDPEYYKIVDLKNPKRVVHALEICYMTGKAYTSFRTQQKKERPFRIIKIGLTRNREELYERINCRVDQMVFGGKRAAVIKTNGNSLEAVVACGGGISYFRKSIAAVTSGIMEVNFLDFDAEKIINRVVAALYRLVYRFGEIFAVGEVFIIHDLARCSGVYTGGQESEGFSVVVVSGIDLFKIIDFFGLGFLITHIRNGLRYRGRRRRILGLGFIAVVTACRK